MGRTGFVLVALALMSLLVVACGPEMATPTPRVDRASGEDEAASTTPRAQEATEENTEATLEASVAEKEEPPDEPLAAESLPVSADDWHVLGSAEAPVTIIEYSDFQ